MRDDPQRFVTFVLGSFALALEAALAFQTRRVWKSTGKCPIMALRGGAWETVLHAAGAFVLWPGSLLAWSYAPGPVWPALDNWAWRLLGLMGFCLASSLGLFAAVELGNSWRMGPDPELTPSFVSTGIYARFRHPMYLAVTLAGVSTFLLAPCGLFLGWALALAVWSRWQARTEERFLEQRFGAPYRDYREGRKR